MPESYYVVGATQKNRVMNDWQQYKSGIILRVSPRRQIGKICVQYHSPSHVIPDHKPSILFTAGTLENKHLYVGTQTEVLKYSLPDFTVAGYLSLPCFNDIHHVRPTKEGNLLIVNTGLDMALEISFQGRLLNEWHVMDKNPWERFNRQTDYRKVATTKPHESHPNYVFCLGKDIWVTRCLQKDAVCVTDSSKIIHIGRELVHDGIVSGDWIYFTQVDGHVIIADSHSLEIIHDYDLNEMTNTKTRLGWCRGIYVVSPYIVIVGFTRVRPDQKTVQNGEIVWRGDYGISSTRIACYDLQRGLLLWEQALEKYGMNAIYSIHSADDAVM